MSMSIRNLKQNEPFELAVSRGDIHDASFINKFGYNSQVGNTAFETVWDGNNAYTYISTAGVATVASSDSDDNGGTVLVSGLDVNYKEVSETLTIGGGAGSVSFYRVFRAQMVTANTGNVNQGNVTVTVDSTSAAIIGADNGQSLMSLYTVPADKTGYLLQIDAGSSKDLEHHIRLVTKTNGGVWNTKAFFTQRGGFSDIKFVIPIVIPAESDIEIQAKASATSAVSSAFELLLVEGD